METTWVDFTGEHMKNSDRIEKVGAALLFCDSRHMKVHKPQWAITSHLIEWSWSEKYGTLNIGNNIE